jgi:hypothetical protein
MKAVQDLKEELNKDMVSLQKKKHKKLNRKPENQKFLKSNKNKKNKNK